MKVIALGASATADDARGFVADTGLESPALVWDAGRTTWSDLGVALQPAAVLLDADGREVARWQGELDNDQVAEALSQLG